MDTVVAQSADSRVAEARDTSQHRLGMVTVNGVRVPYLDWGGSGPALVFIPGMGSTAHVFDDFAPMFVDQFRDDLVADPQRMGLAAKVQVIEDPKITALGSKFRHKVSVAVHLKDGTVLEETVEAPRGSEKTFATAGDIQSKFVKLTRRVLPQAQIDRVIGLVLDLENLQDVSVLIKALAR